MLYSHKMSMLGVWLGVLYKIALSMHGERQNIISIKYFRC